MEIRKRVWGMIGKEYRVCMVVWRSLLQDVESESLRYRRSEVSVRCLTKALAAMRLASPCHEDGIHS